MVIISRASAINHDNSRNRELLQSNIKFKNFVYVAEFSQLNKNVIGAFKIFKSVLINET